MVKYPLPHRPSRAEFRARLKEAKKRGLAGAEAMAEVMQQLNCKYNRRLCTDRAQTWKKPPGFDDAWWNGALLQVRLGVRPTKQERMREQGRRIRFMQMVRRVQRERANGTAVTVVHDKNKRSCELAPSSIHRKLSFPEMTEEEARVQKLFLDATDQAASRLLFEDVVDPGGESLLECLARKNSDSDSCKDALSQSSDCGADSDGNTEDNPVWDLPSSCCHSERSSVVVLSETNV